MFKSLSMFNKKQIIKYKILNIGGNLLMDKVTKN